MRNWDTIEPDKYALVRRRFTPGRARTIDRIVIHHNAGVRNTTEQLRDLWDNSREASAHYQVEADGTIGQLVNDWDTAWHAANADINARSIGIEHANISGPDRWQISDTTIEEGAHLVAALCHVYKLGRPQWGKNVFPHSAFTSTGCPWQLDVGGEDHETYMRRAGYWYDNPTGPSPTPTPQPDKDDTMSNPQLDRVHYELTHEFQSRYKTPDGTQSQFRANAIGYALQNDEKLTRLLDDVLPRIEEKLDRIIALDETR